MKDIDKVVVLDFGSKYTRLLARRIREAKVFSEILPFDTPPEKLKALAPCGIILSGGPEETNHGNVLRCHPEIFHLGIPVLGIGYGMQILLLEFGGKVRAAAPEYGRTTLKVKNSEPLFNGLSGSTVEVWLNLGIQVEEPAPGFVVLAAADHAPAAAVGNHEKRLYGLQFHPEVTHTPAGFSIISNFLFQVCRCRPAWTPESFIERTVAEIQKTVGGKQVLCALSGGVDSTVAAALVQRAVGAQLNCIFVDHGLMRKGEAGWIRRFFQENLPLNLIVVDAGERFLKRLRGITDPEEKRRVVGNEFIRVFEEEARKLGEVDFLVQGTLYPDVIESVSRDGTVKVKSHHNVGGLPPDLKFKLLEPFRLLFKDEVRVIGTKLGLPKEVVWRQPFPGPGLAVRVLGEVTPEKLALLREADSIVTREITEAGWYHKLWQAFAVLTETRSVGVTGDKRTYEHVLAVRAVTSEDAMTADWARLPYDLLDRISRRVINEVPGINRVVYDVTAKPPGTIEWE